MGAGSSEIVETDEIESSKVVLGFGRAVIIFSGDFFQFSVDGKIVKFVL